MNKRPFSSKGTTGSKKRKLIPRFQTAKTQYFGMKAKTELKWKDKLINEVNITNSGTLSTISDMANSANISGILGDECQLKSVTLKLRATSVTNGLGALVRVIVFQFANGTPTVSTALSAGVAGGAPDIQSLINMEHRKQMKILLDQTQYVGSLVAGTFEAPTKIYFQMYKKIPIDHSVCNITSGVPSKNGLFMIVIGSNTSNYPTLAGTIRVRFTDQ